MVLITLTLSTLPDRYIERALPLDFENHYLAAPRNVSISHMPARAALNRAVAVLHQRPFEGKRRKEGDGANGESR